MIRKSGYRFSEKIMLKQKIERDDDSKKSHLALDVAKSEHVGHRIKPRLLAMRPQRRLQRAMREQDAVLGVVRQREAFVGAGKNHAVIAGGGAAAQRGK